MLLCKNAPKEWNNRAALWNAVEKVEKSVRAQLAREYELALPAELERQEQIALLREYIQQNFVDKGMYADMAIHDKGDGNPHAHVMLTMRSVLHNGAGGRKRKAVFSGSQWRKAIRSRKEALSQHDRKKYRLE